MFYEPFSKYNKTKEKLLLQFIGQDNLLCPEPRKRKKESIKDITENFCVIKIKNKTLCLKESHFVIHEVRDPGSKV